METAGGASEGGKNETVFSTVWNILGTVVAHVKGIVHLRMKYWYELLTLL